MDNLRFRDQREVAKFAVFTGLDQTAKKFGLSVELLSSWVQQLDFDDLQIFAEIRSLVKETCRRKGVELAAKEYGLSERLLEQFLRQGEKSVEVLERCHQSTQTPEFYPVKRARRENEAQTVESEVSTDPESPPKRHTTAQKIRAVKRLGTFLSEQAAETEFQVPYSTLIRWRNKVRNCLFQEVHVERLYAKKRRLEKDRFFFELDEAMFKWWDGNKNPELNVDQTLVEKAKIVAKIDDSVPVVSPLWVSSFRAFYELSLYHYCSVRKKDPNNERFSVSFFGSFRLLFTFFKKC